MEEEAWELLERWKNGEGITPLNPRRPLPAQLKPSRLGVKTTNVYFVQALPNGPIKIGVARNIERRMQSLRTASPAPLELLFLLEGVAMAAERRLHARFSEHGMHGEWFRPAREILAAIEELRRDGQGAHFDESHDEKTGADGRSGGGSGGARSLNRALGRGANGRNRV